MLHFKALLALFISAGTYANPVEDGIFGRSLGGSCKTPLGKGSCEYTSNCKGATYNNYCPNDPADVKVFELPLKWRPVPSLTVLRSAVL